MDWFLTVVQDHYFDFEGRARRKEYWMFQLFSVLIVLGIMIVTAILGAISENLAFVGVAAYAIVGLGLVLPSIGVLVRRLHDTGRSGWWYFISLVPLVGTFILLYFLVIEGDSGPNAYGPDPKDPYAATGGIEDFDGVLGS